jgi:DNA-binding transcriptional LysR family regulator
VQLPTMMVRDELARGELVTVLPDWAPRREIVHAVFASRRGLLRACARCSTSGCAVRGAEPD